MFHNSISGTAPRFTAALLAAFLVFATIGPTSALAAKKVTKKSKPASDSIETIKIRPSETDPAIKTFDTPHYAYFDSENLAGENDQIAPRQQLLLWIPGTQKDEADGPGAAAMFCQHAAKLGYHVIILKYPNDESASVCRDDRDPEAFTQFRLALIEGGDSPHLKLPRTESIEHRLIKLLVHLKATRPASENWGQFLNHLNAADQLNWPAIAVAGQSQGGGHAALIGLRHTVARVICFGAPKDYSQALNAPAAWYNIPSATPKNRFFALNHKQDHQGCSPAEQLENLRALGLHAFGPPVSVDQAKPPYAHRRILLTNFPGEKVTSKEAHTTAISPRHASHFAPAWTYLLLEKTD